MFYCQFFGELKGLQVLGKFPFHFNLEFLENFRGCFCVEISERFLYSLQQMIHIDKTTCFSSSKFYEIINEYKDSYLPFGSSYSSSQRKN